MKTPRIALLCCSSLALTVLSCGDAEKPPGKLAMNIQLAPDTSGLPCNVQAGVIPMPVNSDVAHLNASTTGEAADELEKVKDGSDGATVSCSVQELAPGTYNVNITSSATKGVRRFNVAGQTGAAGTARISFKSPEILELYDSSTCTITASSMGMFEGGGALIASFSCTGFASQEEHLAQSCDAHGTFVVQDCDN